MQEPQPCGAQQAHMTTVMDARILMERGPRLPGPTRACGRSCIVWRYSRKVSKCESVKCER